MKLVVAYAFTAFAFLAIDLIWLSRIARRFYADQLGPLLLERPNLIAATVFYLVYAAGIVFFAISPALKADSASIALGHGVLLGLLAYATYDMTNYATLRNWPLSVVIVDTLWGGLLTGFSAYAGFALTNLVTALR